MNPVILAFADGTTFFVGVVLVFIAEASLLWFKNRSVRSALTVCAISGMILVVASATPLPIWIYAGWLLLASCGVILFNRSTGFRRVKLSLCAVLFIATMGLVAIELPYRRATQLTVSPETTIYVLGDSISAGMGEDDRVWPLQLQELSGNRVVNFARAAATVEGALKQAKEITESNALVIVEIGGNDLLGDTEPSSYYESLNQLVGSLVDEHQVLLVELPLFPFQNGFGEAQRRVAAEHDVALLPKRFFTRVLAVPNSTSDGLHLSQIGHTAMAETMNALIVRD